MRVQSAVKYEKKGKQFGGKDYYACLMIKEGTREAILEAADTVMKYDPDLVEWRLDYCLPMEDTDFAEKTLVGTARCLAERLGDIPLLITYRIKEEGGIRKYPRDLRLRMIQAVINTGCIDFIDVEIGSDQEYIDKIKDTCAKFDTKLILSYHNWETVPDDDFLLGRIETALKKGADVPKLYLTANTYEDAMRVMRMALKVRKEKIVKGPMIFCGMSNTTLLTRAMGGDVANDFGYFTITGDKGGVEEDIIYYRQLKEAFDI
ncbi:MAG: type I 3-dehydroquinate dehydratase [Bilifractor sp.]|jgi:3-dehydroquinate dehydratase-1